MKKKIKKQNGITLIALIITIIVMLILVAVTINMAINGGLFSYAGKAVDEMESAMDKEQNEVVNDLIDTILSEMEKNEIPRTSDETLESIYQKDENTYILQSIEDLVILSNNVNKGQTYEGKTFELEISLDFNLEKSYIDSTKVNFIGLGDINGNGIEESLIIELTTGGGFIPIGNEENPFMGKIEGNNNCIKNLYINSTSFAGFVGVGERTEFNNLKILNANINTTTNAGGIIGKMLKNTTIRNCKTTGKIVGNYVGGMIGYADCYDTSNDFIVIENSTNEAVIEGGSGFIGRTYYVETVTLKNNINNGDISGSGNGGMFGYGYGIETAIIEDCENHGNLSSDTSGSAGLVGLWSGSISELTIRRCVNTGNINGYGYVGGIYSSTSASKNVLIEDCYNTGNISGASAVGGIVGDKDSGRKPNT